MQRPWAQKAMMRTAPAPMAQPDTSDTPATIALSLTPVAVVAALLACDPLAAPIAVLTGIALAAGLTAAFTRRWTAMAIAAGVAGGLSPAGLILAPLAIGLSIRVRSVRLPVLGIGAGAVVATTVGWRATASLPSLLDVAIAHPGVAGLVVATGAGLAGWVAATATRPGALAAGGVAGTLALAAFVPMPPVTLALAAMAIMTCYRRPARRTPAANDNSLMRPAMRRQYRPTPARVTNNPLVPQNHAR
jgi:hypothetical protein